MTAAKFLELWKWKRYQESSIYWYQCVSLAKLATFRIHWLKLWSFWWSAKTWWKNYINTFPENTWLRIVNDMNDPNQVPKSWDIIFFDTISQPWKPDYDHVAVVLKSEKWSNLLSVIEQNWASWDWDGKWWDEIRIAKYYYNKYPKVLWWFTPLTKFKKIDSAIKI